MSIRKFVPLLLVWPLSLNSWGEGLPALGQSESAKSEVAWERVRDPLLLALADTLFDCRIAFAQFQLARFGDRDRGHAARDYLLGLYAEQATFHHDCGDFLGARRIFERAAKTIDRFGAREWQRRDVSTFDKDLARLEKLAETHFKEVLQLQDMLIESEFLFLQRDFDKAVQRLDECLKMQTQLLGSDPGVTMACLLHLAEVHLARGDFVQARRGYQSAMDFVYERHGDSHPMYAQTLTKLAQAKWLATEETTALDDLHDADRAWANALGGDGSGEAVLRLGYAYTLYTLAVVHGHVGDSHKAKEYLAKAYQLANSSTPNGNTGDLARVICLLGLAQASCELGRIEDADEYLAETGRILSITTHDPTEELAPSVLTLLPGARLIRSVVFVANSWLGQRSELNAVLDIGRASLLCYQRRFSEGRDILARGRPWESLAPLDRADGFNLLAAANYHLGDMEATTTLLKEAKDAYAMVLGDRHWAISELEGNRASVLLARGKDREATRLFSEVVDTTVSRRVRLFPALSSRQQLAYMQDDLIEAYLHAASKSKAPPREMYQRWIRWKGAVLEWQTAREHENGAGDRRDVEEAQAALGSDRALFAEKRGLFRWQTGSHDVEFGERLPPIIGSSKVPGGRSENTFLRATELGKLLAKLPDGVVIVDFAIATPPEFTGEFSGPIEHKPRELLAFVIRSTGVKLIHLGPMEVISRLVRSWRTTCLDVTGAMRDDTTSVDLWRQLWASIDDSLGAEDRLLISPIGDLWELPFASLADPADHRFLFENHLVANVFVPNLLLDRDDMPRSSSLLLVDCLNADDEACFERMAELGFSDVKYLPLASRAQFIESVSAPSPTCIVCKLHGFAEGAAAAHPPRRRPSLDVSGSSFHFLGPVRSADARLSSVIQFCGPQPSQLTAFEIELLQLRATRLAVFLSCYSASGDSTATEGPQSVQRALHAAGVGTVLANLWDPDEVEAQLLTEEFLRHHMNGEGKLQSLNAAYRALQKRPGRLGRPRFWAGWSLSVDASALEELRNASNRGRPNHDIPQNVGASEAGMPGTTTATLALGWLFAGILLVIVARWCHRRCCSRQK